MYNEQETDKITREKEHLDLKLNIKLKKITLILNS